MSKHADDDPNSLSALTEALAELVHDSDADDPDAALELVRRGADPNGHLKPLNSTPLLEAVTYNRLKTTETLLQNGGSIGHSIARESWKRPSAFSLIRAKPTSPVMWVLAFFMGFLDLFNRMLPFENVDLGNIRIEEECNSKAMARLLVRYGADPTKIECEFRPAAFGADLIAAQEITPDIFNHRSLPRFGISNPEPCNNPFYLEQIRTGRSGYAAGRAVLGEKHSGVDGGPVWSFERFGQTATPLPDGRLVVIAGEHEDHYDPDFNIYNDVTLLDGKGGVQHFLYPKEVFPPTDFHTATLIGDSILLIGNLGYQQQRQAGVTQVLRLSLDDFSVHPVETTGTPPGWINRHGAVLHDGQIIISGGKLEPGYVENTHRHALDLATMNWRRLD